MEDYHSDFGLGVFLTFVFTGAIYFFLVLIQEYKWEQQAIYRGYASYCPMNGEWAWKGECKE